MESQNEASHQARVIERFTKQAVPFARSHWDGVEEMVALSGVGPSDEVLDVACGPGLVACAFAHHARHVTGIDLTAKMIDVARERQRDQGLENMTWQIGTAEPLPYADGAFSMVITRYSLHHFWNPVAAVAQMVRVCQPGGVVLITDVEQPAAKVEAFDRAERLRDTSHTRTMTREEFAPMLTAAGLAIEARREYLASFELEAQILASCTDPAQAKEFRSLVVADLDQDNLGLSVRREGEAITLHFPITIYGCRKPCS